MPSLLEIAEQTPTKIKSYLDIANTTPIKSKNYLDIANSATPKIEKPKSWVAEGLKKTALDIGKGFTDVPAQIQDLLTIPSRLTGLPRPPLVSKLTTETVPYLMQKATAPLATLKIPPLTMRNIKSVLTGKGITETAEIEPSAIDVMFYSALIGYPAFQSVVSKTQWNSMINKLIQTEKFKGTIINNMPAIEKYMTSVGIKLSKDLPIEDKVRVVISQAQKSPTLGDVLIGLERGKIKSIVPIKPVIKPTPVEPIITPTTVTPVAPKAIPAITPTIPSVTPPVKPIIPTPPIVKPIPVLDITKLPDKPIISPELQSLAEEARKYKSAEEFVASYKGSLKVGDKIFINSQAQENYLRKIYNQAVKEVKPEIIIPEKIWYTGGKEAIKTFTPLGKLKIGEQKLGTHFTSSKEYAQIFAGKEGKITSVTLDIKKPYEVSPENELLIEAPYSHTEFINELKKQGYDALILRGQERAFGEGKHDQVFVFYPEKQIKPAPELKPLPKAIKKDYYAEEVETPSAFAGTIAEEIPIITAPSAEIVKRSQIISNLGEKLNVSIRKGGFGGAERATRGALGIYKPKPDIIRWKWGGVGTISHEIGHFLDDNFKDLHELIKSSRPEIGPLDYDSTKQRANEGFSEFLRYWITQPQIALKKAPQFHTQFEGWLNNNPDVRTVLDNAKESYQAWLKMPSVDKVKSQISFEPEAQAQGIKHTLDSLYDKVVKELTPLQRYVDLAKKQGIKVLDEENPYILARLLKGNTGKANHFLNHKTFNTKLEITGKGLREILEPVKNNLEDFSTYLVARRVPELKERGKETGISKQDALNAILDLDKKYSQFKGVVEELYAYQDRLLLYAFGNGLISPMGLIKMKELNKNYVPFYRVFEELQRKGYMGDTLANLSSPIKRMTYKGSEREIIDPIESIMKNTYAIINTADRNAVARGMAILAKQDKKLGRLFEKIATPLSKVATVDLGKEVNKVLAEEGNELPEDDINMIIDIFRPSFFTPKNNTLTIMNGGKKEFYYVDSEIYKAMLGLEKEEMSMLIKVLSYPAKWLRAGATTLSPEFIARNPLRDQFSAYVYSKTGYVPIVDLARGIFNLVGKSDLYWEWVRGGGEHATIVSVDRDYMRQNLKELFNKNWKDAINPLKWMQALSEFGEQGTRLGEFIRGRIKGMGIKESAFTARDVTLDFAQMGSKIKTANKITAFMNANIQGLFRPAQAFRERPVATWFKILTGITLPSIILYLMNRDDERYKELPRWQRDLFWIVRVPAKTPSGEILLRIPKPFELGIIFGSVPERILEYIDTQDPTSFDKLRDTVIEGAYLNPKQWIPTALVPILENMTNWSFFRDRKLETMGMERVLPEERYTAFTSETAKKLGRVLGYSPVKIENLVSGYTGAGGQLTLDLLDFLVTGGKKKLPTTPETMPVIRGFVAKEPVGSFSESVNKFYENYEKITEVYNTMQEANKRGDRDKFNELRKRYPKVNPMTNGMIVRESKRLAEGRKEINKILDSEDIPETKLQKIRSISVRMTEIAKQVNNRLKEQK